MDIDTYIAQKGEMIEKYLAHFVPEKEVLHRSLYKAARYSLLGGGKRIRPILAIATAETLGRKHPIPFSVPCSLELVHTYSLIHDDLPCMDDDDYRRGKPSLHVAYNEGQAVLTGDFLLTRAFEILALEPLLPSSQKAALIALLAKHSGGDGMIGGQVADIELLHKKTTLPILQQIHFQKTAALITASVEMGAILARSKKSEKVLLQNFGECIGLAFQIMDDVLDEKDNPQKDTYVSLLGIQKAKEEADRYLHQALNALKKLNIETPLLEGLAKKLVHRSH